MSPLAGEMLCTEIVPRIHSAIPASTRMIGAEDASELIQDTIATAAAMLHRAEAVGKKVAASTVAFFAVKLTKSGRRSTSNSKTDVMHPGTQLVGRTRVVSFDVPLGFDEAGDSITLADVFENKQDDPSMLAARNLDWETFYGRQTHRGRKLPAVVAEGSTLRCGARLLGLSDSGVQLEKKKLALALSQFMGVGILAESTREPRWRDNIRAGRERQACRAARL